MKKVVFVIFAIAAILIGGKFFLEHQYKKNLDELIQQASFFVNASYDKVYIDTEGAVNITNINVSDKMGKNVNFRVDNLKFFSSDRTVLVKGLDAIQEGNFPETLRLSAKNLQFDLSLLQEINSSRECRYFEEPVDYGKFIDSNISSDFVINLQSESDFQFNVISRFLINGMSDTSIDLVLEKSLLKSNIATVASQEIPLRNFKVSNTHDPAYSKSFINYCAKKLNITADQYINDVLGSDEFYSTLNIIPSIELKESLKQHFTGNNTLTISGKPNSTARRDLQQLSLFAPKQIIQSLSLKVEADGIALNNLISDTPFIKTTNSSEQSITANGTDSESLSAETDIQTPSTEQKPVYSRRFTFEPIEKSNASNFIDKTIKVYRKKRVIEGELLEANSASIKINNTSFGGSTIMNLALEEIDAIEVKTFKRLN